MAVGGNAACRKNKEVRLRNIAIIFKINLNKKITNTYKSNVYLPTVNRAKIIFIVV